jgi:hypothetical protein
MRHDDMKPLATGNRLEHPCCCWRPRSGAFPGDHRKGSLTGHDIRSSAEACVTPARDALAVVFRWWIADRTREPAAVMRVRLRRIAIWLERRIVARLRRQ